MRSRMMRSVCTHDLEEQGANSIFTAAAVECATEGFLQTVDKVIREHG